mmetsp:Transcript_63378/g.181845  ORF Transcript_63378/g.181845 Transcript_63378/m.181845 type:complete len:248 (+) Transcript_63378:142-885(+)
MHPCDRRTAGRRHVILELPRVLLCLHDHLARTHNSLCRQSRCDWSGQAHPDATIGEGLDHQIDIGWSRAREPRHSIEQLLVAELLDDATAAHDGLHCLAVLGIAVWAQHENGCSRTDKRRGVRHDACDAGVGEVLRNGVYGLAGHDGDQEHVGDGGIAFSLLRQILEHDIQHLRLDSHDDDIRGLAHLGVVLADDHLEGVGQKLPALGVGLADVGIAGLQPALEQAAQHGLGHHTSADETHLEAHHG